MMLVVALRTIAAPETEDVEDGSRWAEEGNAGGAGEWAAPQNGVPMHGRANRPACEPNRRCIPGAVVEPLMGFANGEALEVSSGSDRLRDEVAGARLR